MLPRLSAYRKYYDDRQARRYAAVKEGATGTNAAEIALVRRGLAGAAPGESILDIPCGSGRVAVHLARWGYRVACADVSPAMLDCARERFRAEGLGIPLHEADLEGTDFADGAFDNVLCFRLFHHFPDDALRRRAAKELLRIARRRVLVSYHDARSFTSIKRAVEAQVKGKELHKYPLRPAAMAACFRDPSWRVARDVARFPLLHSLRLLVLERVPDAARPPA